MQEGSSERSRSTHRARVGIDVGGTKVAAGLVDSGGRLLGWSRRASRPELGAPEMTALIVEQVAELLEEHGVAPSAIDAVGLGLPGDFERPGGRLLTIPNLPAFVGEEPVALFRRAWEDHLGLPPPIFAENDTVVAVLAEARFGAGRGVERVFYLTVSTGVGGARFDGERAENIEPGWNLYPDPRRPQSSLESLAGGVYLAAAARETLEGWQREGVLGKHTTLFERVEVEGDDLEEKIRHLTTRHLGEAAALGDVYCRRLFEAAADQVAAGLALLLAQGWGEERIVVGGSVAIKVPGYLDRMRSTLEWHRGQSGVDPALAAFEPSRQLVEAALGEERGILGAVLLADDGWGAVSSRRSAVRAIAPRQARPLRQKVLRPHQSPEECIYEGDEDPGSAHYGAVVDGQVVGIASIYRQREDGTEDPFTWRLRGMATDPSVRGEGYGRALLEAVVEHARREGGMRLWCNARTGVADFYGAAGFVVQGEEFDLPGLGPHKIMEREL
jgi:predicted NBD/HSP70 family sugar kinase/GNAT superfamily N-acetyltransferase